MNEQKGRSLELFFVDGQPDGMLTAEVFNWTGHVLVAPRTQISAALRRPEARHTGVYLLIGEKDGEPYAYIGEGEDISDRIRNHDSNKDWWNTAVLIVSASNNLNKAHVKYLESRLIDEARSIGKIKLDNGNAPGLTRLSEAHRANMEAFLEYVFLILPALRIDFLLRSTRPDLPSNNHSDAMPDAATFELSILRNKIHATAKVQNGEFVVQAGSVARKSWEGKGTETSGYAQLHSELVNSGILAEQGDQRVFTANYKFSSPSAAAAVVNGRPANGTIEWKVGGTQTPYKQWEAEQLAKDAAEAS